MYDYWHIQKATKSRNLNINFNGVQIEFVKQTKLLGVYIDNTLSWNAHIDFQENCAKES